MPPDATTGGGGGDRKRASIALTLKLAAFLIAALVGPVAAYAGTAYRGPVAAGVLALWFLLVVAAGVELFVRRPLEQLTSTIDLYLETGKIKREITAPPSDEIGRLVGKFRQMAARLQGVPASAREAIAELGTAVGELGEQLHALATAVEDQAARLAEARATLRDLQRSSSWARTQADSVLEAVARTDDLGLSGRSSVEQGLQGLQQIRSKLEGIVGQIAALGRQTGEVGGVLETVKEVADQSHFLAVNATIEAARAGELGKGFTVVAREVRMLADQSLRSSGQMQDLLDELRDSIGSTVSQAEGGSAQIEEGLDRVRASGERLKSMTVTIDQTSQSARRIAASIGQQDESIGRLAREIEQLDRAMIRVVTEIGSIERLAERLRSGSLGLSALTARVEP